jgi:Cof subfamily protein (haloacid dehalogenase superfamily)
VTGAGMRPAPQLIVLDLDGTLLGADGAVSEPNSAVLGRAVDAGARVIIATGRPPRWLDHLRADIPSTLALCCNGGIVLDLATDDVLASYPLDGAALLRAVTELRRSGSVFAVGAEGLPEFGIAVEPDFPFRANGEIRRMPLEELCASYVVKVLIRPEPGTGQPIVDHFAANYPVEFTLTRSTNDGLIEISRAGITKGAVIAGLAETWGIDSSAAIAFGDMPNDIEMLRWAGHSVAMGNADDAVKAISTEVAGHHDQSAVAGVLNRWFPASST